MREEPPNFDDNVHPSLRCWDCRSRNGLSRTIKPKHERKEPSTHVCPQVNVLRATEEIGEIEKSRVREEAKAEVLAAKKELRTLAKRMDQQCTREVHTCMRRSRND